MEKEAEQRGGGGEAYTILSCTSQDTEAHPATAVKSPTATTYWQTEAPEKKAALELALASPVQIERIVIGNAGAAFVEILVGKSTSRPVDYQVLQPIKPLCTMSESKSGANRYGGYSFADKFERNVAKQTWDRVKIICTQPWNVGPLGLSFVIVNPTSDVSHLLKPSVGSSALSKPAPHAPLTASTTTSSTTSSAKPSATSFAPKPTIPTPSSDKNKEKKAEESVPLNKLLAGVTFVISGIQNPERGDLRDKATKMGAKYQLNWDNKATHLICAFQDTPKYREVKGKGGIIVKPEWITDSFAQKKRLPLTKYTFEKASHVQEQDEAEEKPESKNEDAPREEEEEEEEEGLLDRRKTKNLMPPPPPSKTSSAVREDDSDTEEMDELDLGPTLPIALPTEAHDYDDGGNNDDDDMLPTLPIARDDDDLPTYAAKKTSANANEDDDEDEGTEEIDESELLPTLPISEFQQVKGKKEMTAKDDEKKAESVTSASKKRIQQEEEDEESFDLPTLAIGEDFNAYSGANKSNAMRQDYGESDTEEMEEEEEQDDLNATLPIPEYTTQPSKKAKETPLGAQSSVKMLSGKQSKLEKEEEESDTEEMDEVDLLPTLPITTTSTKSSSSSSSSSSSLSAGKRKREVSKTEEDEDETSGTEPLADVDASSANKESGVGMTTKKTPAQPPPKKQKPESAASDVLGKLYAVRPLPDFLDGVNVFFHGKEFDADMRDLLRRYIVAYKGRVSPYLFEDVTHVVSTDEWGKDFDRARKEHASLVFVRPDWVLECHLQQNLVSPTPYRLTPA